MGKCGDVKKDRIGKPGACGGIAKPKLGGDVGMWGCGDVRM